MASKMPKMVVVGDVLIVWQSILSEWQIENWMRMRKHSELLELKKIPQIT